MVRESLITPVLNPVPSCRSFGGLSPPNKTPRPQTETRNTISQWSFCQFLECQVTPPKTQGPPIENFLATVLPKPGTATDYK